MQKVLRRNRRCNPAVLLSSSQKVVVAVSMADEQAALNGCECNSVFQSLHFFIMSEEPPEDNYILGMVEFSVIRNEAFASVLWFECSRSLFCANGLKITTDSRLIFSCSI